MRVRIEKLVYGGEGLAHSDGATLFVPFVVPGEEVEAVARARSKKVTRCSLQGVLTASKDRIDPACPHFGVCGGCHYQHIPYEAQLRFKEEILRETLRRLGHLDWTEPIAIHPSPPFRYRNRAQWKIRPLKNDAQHFAKGATNDHSVGIGYFRASSSILCPVESCAILSPRVASTLGAFRQMIADRTLPDGIQEIEVFADSDDQSVLLNISCSFLTALQRTFVGDISRAVEGLESVLLEEIAGARMELTGPGYINYGVDGKQFRVGHLSFFQVNRYVVEELARSVATAAGSGELALDLYAGVGLLSVFLADRFARVESVEADPAAARDLEVNAPSNATNIVSHNLSAEAFLPQWKRKRGTETPDTIVVDPPRAGLDPGVIKELFAVSAQRIVYVSCDPATLARDLAQLCARLYKVQDIHLFDMFPQTYHIETLVRLGRAS